MNIIIHCPPATVEMPSATTAKYAAARVAEALGHDVSDGRLTFALEELGGRMIEADHVMADHDGKRLRLYGARR